MIFIYSLLLKTIVSCLSHVGNWVSDENQVKVHTGGDPPVAMVPNSAISPQTFTYLKLFLQGFCQKWEKAHFQFLYSITSNKVKIGEI